MGLMGISGFIYLDPFNYISKWVFIYLTQILKWVGLRLIQIRWVINEFMDMDKNYHHRLESGEIWKHLLMLNYLQ